MKKKRKIQVTNNPRKDAINFHSETFKDVEISKLIYFFEYFSAMRDQTLKNIQNKGYMLFQIPTSFTDH